MRNRLKRVLLLSLCTMALFAIFSLGAHAYSYPSMPSDWENVQVTVGTGSSAVTMPLTRYPSGSTFSNSAYMTQAEAKSYGITSVGSSGLYLRGTECVGFARYVYAALFYKYAQNASIDNALAYTYSGNYAYVDMIYKVLGTKTLAAGYSASTLKTLFTACQPGAVMRCGGHSMVLMAIYDDGFLIYDANFSYTDYNVVNVRAYTWASFVEKLGGRGIQALQMPAYYPGFTYSTGDNTYYAVDTSTAGSYVVCNCTTLNVRAKPSTSATRVGTLSAGDEVEVLGTYNGWAQILYKSTYCWVHTDYIKAGSSVNVTFDPNGGTASFTSKEYISGEQFGSLPTVTKANRTFLGWSDGTTIYTASSIVPAEDLSLTATWCVLTYEDVDENAWYASYVEKGYNYGLISKDSLYNPTQRATRGQVITVLGREYELETGQSLPSASGSVFLDVQSDAYYAKYVIWATGAGITYGTSETTFDPDTYITREQLATFMYRMAIYTGRTTEEERDTSVLNRFGDSAQISYYATDAICWAVSAGILQGDDQGNVNPVSNATRAEMITMFCRYMDYAASASTRSAEQPEMEEEPEEEEEPVDEALPAEEAPAPETEAEETAAEEDVTEPLEPAEASEETDDDAAEEPEADASEEDAAG